MTDFRTLQAEHQDLLRQHESGDDKDALVRAAQEYIERGKSAAESISAPRDRDQLRANLRFWAAFIFDETGTYPDTTLRPAATAARDEQTAPAESPARWNWLWLLLIPVILILVVGLLALLGPSIGAEFTPIISLYPSPTRMTSTSGPPTALAVEATRAGEVATVTATATETPGAGNGGGEDATLTPTQLPTLPATGGGGYTHVQLLATISAEPHDADCEARTIDIAFDGADFLSPEELAGAQVQVSQAGTGDLAGSATLEASGESISFDLGKFGAATDESFLITVDHPSITISSVVLQFAADCSRNQTSVSYVAQERFSLLEAGMARDSNLSLDWRLLTWGPSPYGHTWVASIQLNATGGDGRYFFWADGVLLPDDQIVVTGQACDPAQLAVGVTSGGRALLRELVLQSPYCP